MSKGPLCQILEPTAAPSVKRFAAPPPALTVLEDTLHVQPVGGARLVVGAAFEVVGQLAGTAVVDHPGVGRADGV